MSSAILLLLFLVVAAPALIAFFRRDLGWKTGGFYALVSAGLLAWHLGFSVGPLPDRAALRAAPVGIGDGSRCEQVLSTAERGRIVLDRRDPNRLVVAGALWQQMPEEVRGAITECASVVRPADRRDTPVEVVTR